MTLSELMAAVLAVCPDAMFDETGDGEVIVHTGMRIHPDEDWGVGALPVTPIDE
jgi:hypothetical protein